MGIFIQYTTQRLKERFLAPIQMYNPDNNLVQVVGTFFVYQQIAFCTFVATWLCYYLRRYWLKFKYPIESCTPLAYIWEGDGVVCNEQQQYPICEQRDFSAQGSNGDMLIIMFTKASFIMKLDYFSCSKASLYFGCFFIKNL